MKLGLIIVFVTFTMAWVAHAQEALSPDLAKIVNAALTPESKCVLDKPFYRDARLIALTANCELKIKNTNTPYNIEVTVHLENKDGAWAYKGARALNSFDNPFVRPSWQDFKTFTPEIILKALKDYIKRDFPDEEPLEVAQTMLDGIGLQFANTPQIKQWTVKYAQQLETLKTLMLAHRSANEEITYETIKAFEGATKLSRLIGKLGFSRCSYERINSELKIWEEGGPEFECVYAFVPGDNYAGLYWAAKPRGKPLLSLNRVYYLYDLGAGWYAFKET